jgi:hypothetical protein
MGILRTRPDDQPRGRAAVFGSGRVTLYGCDKYKECDSDPWPSPPYNPLQPKRCETHRQPMTTRIED